MYSQLVGASGARGQPVAAITQRLDQCLGVRLAGFFARLQATTLFDDATAHQLR
nr:hypothetical protein CPGR_01603 [Mycolicibacter nonchromogenicus]